jgi:hypothetical protein
LSWLSEASGKRRFLGTDPAIQRQCSPLKLDDFVLGPRRRFCPRKERKNTERELNSLREFLAVFAGLREIFLVAIAHASGECHAKPQRGQDATIQIGKNVFLFPCFSVPSVDKIPVSRRTRRDSGAIPKSGDQGTIVTCFSKNGLHRLIAHPSEGFQ